MMLLPRQARDKHRENSQKYRCFVAGVGVLALADTARGGHPGRGLSAADEADCLLRA